MKKVFTIVAFFLISVVVLNSCSKYEDGPGISLRSKKARMANIWKIDKITDLDTGNEVDQNEFMGFADSSGASSSVVLTFDIKKDGKIDVIATISAFSLTVASGTWEFVGDTGIKISVTSTYMNTAGAQIIEGTILRLANNELWIKDKDNYQMNLASDK
ncbi:MAG: hypothetical protein A2033_07710 [Bacteroidetes bacterium GWA2_31_9]|nr:MAG: hypothetical protein A2033_07710 [Bacteroidetes bacterium GWA2_31_9]